MTRRFILLTLASTGLLLAEEAPDAAPWSRARNIAQFDALLKRSPFSVPTAEESAPLADRFSLTGVVVVNGEPEVFVLDRNTLNRERISTAQAPSGLQLVEYLPSPDPRKMRATIKLGDQTATISFREDAAPQNALGQNGAPNAAMPQQGNVPPPQQGGVPNAVQVVRRDQPGAPGATPRPRIIRRTIIQANPTPAK